MRTGELGYWWSSIGGPASPREPLRASTEADVAIVGAGYTGLWTAYYLKRARPELRIVLLEREVAGYGASGRNGGWVSGFFSGEPGRYARAGSPDAYLQLQRHMFAAVDEVGAFLSEHGIDAVALGAAQMSRLEQGRSHARELGLGEADLRLLGAGELEARVRVAGALGASYSPHAARVHPAALVRGLAGVVESMGVVIHERTPVREVRPGEAVTPAGSVRARWVVRATEGYTGSLRGCRRRLVPINSSMVITQPLGEAAWEQIGWGGCEVMSDLAHVYVYLQRTADGRIAIGGRGVPYRYGSRTDGAGATAARTIESLRRKLADMFPAAAGAELTHAWSGVLGVPRDWCPSVAADAHSGLARAGGYVGEGVAASNLAARSLRDLLLGEDSELARLAWVGTHARNWEPEPLRWASIGSVYSLYRLADRREASRGRPSRLGRVIDAASGRS
jgi:glycine/D-amino acid oxidase-like deaminating enzyme